MWSVDWWTHRAKALDALHEALKAHREADRKKREEASQAMGANVADSSSHPGYADGPDEEIATPICSTEVTVDGTDASGPDFEPRESYMAAHLAKPEPSAGEVPSSRMSEPPADLFSNNEHSYVVAYLDGGNDRADPDMFYSEEYKPRLSAMIDHVIDMEGPIHEDVLVRRIARYHGFQRAGRQIREIVIDIAKRRQGRTEEDVGLCFWRKGKVEDRLTPARYAGRDDELRKAEYICKEAIRAIKDLLFLSDDPVEIARHIGIARLSQSARDRLSKALTAYTRP